MKVIQQTNLQKIEELQQKIKALIAADEELKCKIQATK